MSRALAVTWLLLGACGKGGGERRALDAAPPVTRATPDAAPTLTAPPGATAYPDLAAAIEAILAEAKDTRMVGFGELHSRADLPVPGPSALARFAREVMPVIGARTSDLVLETWVVDPPCKTAEDATPRVEAAVQRPAAVKT